MCPDIIRGPYSRVFFPTEPILKCDSQQGFFNPAFESIFDLLDERSNALLLSCERAQQQTNDSGNYPNFQPIRCDSPRLNEIDTGWMSEVLDDLPVISQEITQLPVAEISPPFPNYQSFNPPLTLSLELLSSEVDDDQGKQQTTPTCAAVGPKMFDIKQAAPISPDSKHSALGDDSALSPPCTQSANGAAAKSLRTRRSKRRDRRQQEPKRMPKWAREVNFAPSEQVEHVLRERQRRDDMSCRIAILEALLPPCPKRDRASIVHDSVQYVKSLQQGVEELQNKLIALKRNNSTPKTNVSTSITKNQIKVLPQLTKDCNPSIPSVGPATDSSASNSDTVAPKLFYFVEFHVQLEGCSEAAKLTRCKCRSDYLSRTMITLEQLNVEVSRCSVTKMFDHYMCVIVMKPRLSAVPAPTSASIATSLQTAVAL